MHPLNTCLDKDDNDPVAIRRRSLDNSCLASSSGSFGAQWLSDHYHSPETSPTTRRRVIGHVSIGSNTTQKNGSHKNSNNDGVNNINFNNARLMLMMMIRRGAGPTALSGGGASVNPTNNGNHRPPPRRRLSWNNHNPEFSLNTTFLATNAWQRPKVELDTDWHESAHSHTRRSHTRRSDKSPRNNSNNNSKVPSSSTATASTTITTPSASSSSSALPHKSVTSQEGSIETWTDETSLELNGMPDFDPHHHNNRDGSKNYHVDHNDNDDSSSWDSDYESFCDASVQEPANKDYLRRDLGASCWLDTSGTWDEGHVSLEWSGDLSAAAATLSPGGMTSPRRSVMAVTRESSATLALPSPRRAMRQQQQQQVHHQQSSPPLETLVDQVQISLLE
jgi:hypothetical protein